MSFSTPIALLIFNRPEVTEKVFSAIRQARPKKLLVVADGPRLDKDGEAEKCAETREIIDRIDWDCEVIKNFSDTNLGCKQRVSSGLDWIFSMVEEAIILEDDCVPHPNFFDFCETLLEKYRDDERIMMIAGTNHFLNTLQVEEDYVFSRCFGIWGWASWRRAWEKYDVTIKSWEILKAQDQLSNIYPQKHMKLYWNAMFDSVYEERIDTWDFQWVYCCLFNNGLSIIPRVNLISNIGIIGHHSTSEGRNHNLPTFPIDIENMKHPAMVFPNYIYDRAYFETNIDFRPWKRRARLGKLRPLLSRLKKSLMFR